MDTKQFLALVDNYFIRASANEIKNMLDNVKNALTEAISKNRMKDYYSKRSEFYELYCKIQQLPLKQRYQEYENAKKLADNGVRAYQTLYGNYCVRKLPGSKNHKEGVKYLLLAAEQGDYDAMFELGMCYRSGIGVDEDSETSWKWMEKASGIESGIDWEKVGFEGSPEATLQLALYCIHDNPEFDSVCLYLLAAAVAQGHPLAKAGTDKALEIINQFEGKITNE
jgi:hypothetical protein